MCGNRLERQFFEAERNISVKPMVYGNALHVIGPGIESSTARNVNLSCIHFQWKGCRTSLLSRKLKGALQLGHVRLDYSQDSCAPSL